MIEKALKALTTLAVISIAYTLNTQFNKNEKRLVEQQHKNDSIQLANSDRMKMYTPSMEAQYLTCEITKTGEKMKSYDGVFHYRRFGDNYYTISGHKTNKPNIIKSVEKLNDSSYTTSVYTKELGRFKRYHRIYKDSMISVGKNGKWKYFNKIK